LANNGTYPQVLNVSQIKQENIGETQVSAMGQSLEDLLARAANVRPDQITTMLNYTSDAIGMMKVLRGLSYGDNPLANTVLMLCVAMELCWKQPIAFLPLSSQILQDTNSTIAIANPAVSLDYNRAGAAWGADLGSPAAPVDPYEPGGVASIAFHLSLATRRPGNPFVFAPLTILNSNEVNDPQTSLFLFLLFCMVNPAVLGQVLINTTDAAGNNPLDQMFMTAQSLIAWPGTGSLDVILPLRGSYPPPVNAVDAALKALVVPSWGPTPAQGILANAPLTINTQGAAFVSYPWPAYSYSFMAGGPISKVDTFSVIKVLNLTLGLLNRQGLLEPAFHIASMLSFRYNTMQTEASIAPANPVYAANNTDPALLQLHANGLGMPRIVANYPTRTVGFDVVLPVASTEWMSGIFMGIYQTAPVGTAPDWTTRLQVGDPQLLVYGMLCNIKYATTWQALWSGMQMPVEFLNSIFQGVVNQKLAKVVMACFVNTISATKGHLIAPAGANIDAFTTALTGMSVPKSYNGTSPNAMWTFPRAGWFGPSNPGAATYQGKVVPAYLADVWQNLFRKTQPRGLQMLLGPLKGQTGLLLSNGAIMAFANQTVSVPVPYATQGQVVTRDSVPEFDDNYIHNLKLIYHLVATAFLADLTGLAVPAGECPQPGQVVVQRFSRPDFWSPAVVACDLRRGLSTWFPFMTQDGRRLTIMVPGANAAYMTSILSKKTQIGAPQWILGTDAPTPNILADGGGGVTTSWLLRGGDMPASNTATSAGEEKTD
jgi:hypothetical protein